MICWTDHKQFTAYKEFVVQKLRPAIRKHGIDGIVCQGRSGVMMAAPVAAELGIPCIYVGRAGEKHSSAIVNQSDLNKAKHLLFLDDHISTGNTFARVQKAVQCYGKNLEFSFEYNPTVYHSAGRRLIATCEHPKIKHYVTQPKPIPKAVPRDSSGRFMSTRQPKAAQRSTILVNRGTSVYVPSYNQT